ncbi:MAG: hypothetical protein ACNA75_04025 [Thiohalomonadaceae bacterium]
MEIDMPVSVGKEIERILLGRRASHNLDAESDAPSTRHTQSISRGGLAWTAVEIDQSSGLTKFKIGDFLLKPVRKLNTETDDPDTLPDFIPGGFAEIGLVGHHAQQVEGADTILYSIERGGGKVAMLVADVKDGQIVAIHDMESYTKNQGLGSAIVGVLAANSHGEIKIINAQDSSKPFWNKLGARHYDPYNNTAINWQSYRTSPIGRQAGFQDGGNAVTD